MPDPTQISLQQLVTFVRCTPNEEQVQRALDMSDAVFARLCQEFETIERSSERLIESTERTIQEADCEFGRALLRCQRSHLRSMCALWKGISNLRTFAKQIREVQATSRPWPSEYGSVATIRTLCESVKRNSDQTAAALGASSKTADTVLGALPHSSNNCNGLGEIAARR